MHLFCGEQHPVGEITRKMGVSDVTFDRWKKLYANLGVAEIRRLKQLEEDNRRLKQLVADLTLGKQMLQEVLSKSIKACSSPGVSQGDAGYIPCK